MSQSIDLKDVQQKLYAKLQPSGWGDKLKMFLLSEEFTQILRTLMQESSSGTKFTPLIKNLFRAFEECPYDKTKVVILGQDPYPRAGVADGIAFSCSITGKPEASLRYINHELKYTMFKEDEAWEPQTDLTYLANQGILLLNTALTCSVSKPGSHLLMWRPFIAHVLDTLAFDKPQLAYVFMGGKAKGWAKSVPPQSFKFFTSHPASAAYGNLDRWDTGDMFPNLTKVTKEKLNLEIQW